MQKVSSTRSKPGFWHRFESSRRSDAARLIGDVVFLCAFLGAVRLWSARPWPMLVVVVAILGLRFATVGTRRDWLILLLGIVLGGGNDLMSMIRGVYAYSVPHPLVPWPIPLWMFLFWGQAFLVMHSLFAWGPFRGPGADRPLWPPGSALVIDIIGLLAMKAVFYRFYAVTVVPELLAVLILVATYTLHGITRTDLRVMGITLVTAPLVEWALIAAGIYDYTNGLILGMPVWLLVFWLYATPLLKRVFDRIEYEPSPVEAPVAPSQG